MFPPGPFKDLPSWAQAERPDVALVAASGYLSNPAKDWIEQYRRVSRPPFRFRHWERPQLNRFIADHVDLLERHDIYEHEAGRSPEEIRTAEPEYYNRLWYERSTSRDYFVTQGQVLALPDDLRKQILAARTEIEDEYGAEGLVIGIDWEAELIAGKLSALRWVIDDEWDMLDT